MSTPAKSLDPYTQLPFQKVPSSPSFVKDLQDPMTFFFLSACRRPMDLLDHISESFHANLRELQPFSMFGSHGYVQHPSQGTSNSLGESCTRQSYEERVGGETGPEKEGKRQEEVWRNGQRRGEGERAVEVA